ncbi:unnamed protein product, partial [marine sediment metagenome]
MKVLLRRNVSNLGTIGEVVDVKGGYARNYLLPQRLAVEPTKANVKTVEADKQRYLEELARERQALELRAESIRGKEITITARANEEGHLYGSIGPAQIVAAMAETGVFLESSHIVLDEPIRKLDKYDVTVRLAEGITATIHVWVVPHHDEGLPEEAAAKPTDAQETAEAAQDSVDQGEQDA